MSIDRSNLSSNSFTVGHYETVTIFETDISNGIPAKYLPWFPYNHSYYETPSGSHIQVYISVKRPDGSWVDAFSGKQPSLFSTAKMVMMSEKLSDYCGGEIWLPGDPYAPNDIICGLRYHVFGKDVANAYGSMTCTATVSTINNILT